MDADDSVIKEQAVCAVPDANRCSEGTPFSSVMFVTPPRKKHMPMTRSRLDKIDPSMDDLTTSIWLFCKAIMLTWSCVSLYFALTDRASVLTINSTALPKVAFRRPPSVSPSLTEISSVAKESMAARGIIAKKLRVKTAVALHSSAPAMRPSGTKMRRTLT